MTEKAYNGSGFKPEVILKMRPGDLQDAEIKGLLKIWHPDVCDDPSADAVFEHLMSMRAVFSTNSEKITVVGRSGDKHIEIYAVAESDVGRRWVGPDLVAMSFDKEPDLADVFWNNIREVPRGDGKMKKQIRASIPASGERVQCDGTDMIMFARRSRAVLADWVSVHGSVPPIHAAWMCSGLLNIACWSDWAGWALPGISMESVVINPETHEVGLIWGWEAACPLDRRPVVASRRTLGVCPALAAPGRTPSATLTLDVLRLTMREALGDASGMMLVGNGVPEPMVDWLRSPSANSAVDDYRRWQKAVERAFGPRKFVEWEKSTNDVYPMF